MARFLDKIFPDVYISSVYQLPLLNLKEKGIQTLVFDIDNTVAPFDLAEPDDNLISLFRKLKAEGFRLCILSNNNKARVSKFNRVLKTLAIHKAGKPGIRKLQRGLHSLGTEAVHSAMIGDQIFTDMWCGRKAGLYCIMTAPICNRDQWMTRIKRGIERLVMNEFFKRNPEKVLK